MSRLTGPISITDRSIYRPGQTINFKGVIRVEDDAAFSLPGMREVDVMIRSATYEEVFNETLPVSDLGTFDGTFTLEDGAPLGQYAIVVMLHDHYAEEYFTVAAYRAPEFEVTVDIAIPEAQQGDDIEATLNAAYYFGGPLADTGDNMEYLRRELPLLRHPGVGAIVSAMLMILISVLIAGGGIVSQLPPNQFSVVQGLRMPTVSYRSILMVLS